MQVTYDYSNYPDAVADESSLVLYDRDDNADLTWADNGATLNTVANTLTNTNQNIRYEYIIALNNGALPITLTEFEVSLLTGKREVLVEWTTESEINNDYFEIERSTDALNWYSIEKINGAGNSSSKIDYSTIDKTPNLSQINYYRLKQVDFNGDYSYSETRSVSFKEIESSVINIYPNPINNILTINIPNTKQINKIKIVNVNGKTVYQSNISSSKTNINLSELSKGIYFIQLTGANYIETFKVVKN